MKCTPGRALPMNPADGAHGANGVVVLQSSPPAAVSKKELSDRQDETSQVLSTVTKTSFFPEILETVDHNLLPACSATLRDNWIPQS